MKPVPPDTNVVVRVVDTEPVTWPVYWSAIWVGTLSALATALIIGLTGVAIGARHLAPNDRILRWGDVGPATLIFTVIGAFFAFVVGGWVAAKIAGTRRAESSALHGAIVWLLAVPMLMGLAALGVSGLFGGWYGGLAGTPFWVTPTAPIAEPSAAIATRNGALAALTALLIGLVGSVIGGWMASGEPMSIAYYRATHEPGTGRPRDLNLRRSA
jgi:hypothetical protein